MYFLNLSQPRLPDAPLEVRALTDQVERTLVQERLLANLAGGFGVVELVLACVGLYGNHGQPGHAGRRRRHLDCRNNEHD
jgi:hypothetical protein